MGTAAVHAGLLQPGQAGLVKVEIVPSGERFEGSTRHGDAHDAEPRGAFRFLRDYALLNYELTRISLDYALLNYELTRISLRQ